MPPIENHSGGTVITGNAVNWFACLTVLSAMNIYLKTGLCVNRAYTAQSMRDFATRHTNQRYPRGRKGLQAAHDDLKAWIDARRPDDVPRR